MRVVSQDHAALILGELRSISVRMSGANIYCIVCGVAEVYGSVPPIPRPGDWYDLVWGSVVIVALVIASSWSGKEAL